MIKKHGAMSYHSMQERNALGKYCAFRIPRQQLWFLERENACCLLSTGLHVFKRWQFEELGLLCMLINHQDLHFSKASQVQSLPTIELLQPLCLALIMLSLGPIARQCSASHKPSPIFGLQFSMKLRAPEKTQDFRSL